MATVQLSEANFEAVVQKGIVLIDWWASWCGPCRTFAPIYEQASERHQDVVFGKIDTDAEPRLSATFEIRSIPTLMVFRDGVLLFAQPGVLPGPVLDELIAKVRAVDMDEVRRTIEAENAAGEQDEGQAGAEAQPAAQAAPAARRDSGT